MESNSVRLSCIAFWSHAIKTLRETEVHENIIDRVSLTVSIDTDTDTDTDRNIMWTLTLTLTVTLS